MCAGCARSIVEWVFRPAEFINPFMGFEWHEAGSQPTLMSANEQRLRQAQKTEAIGRLACGIAHDFNNPLTAITGYTELVMANLAGTDPMIQDVSEIQRAASSAARLTKQVRAFGSPQPPQTEVRDSTVGVGATFTIDLPATFETSPGADLSASPPRVVDGRDTAQQPTDEAFLTKPFAVESLTHVVQHAMARAS